MDAILDKRPRARTARGTPPRPGLGARVQGWLADGGDQSIAQRMAGTAFAIRVSSAAVIYISQVLLARWMGVFEFGVYVYVWTWVLLVGDIVHMGLASAAQRFIPEYTRNKAFDSLRGFLSGSRWLVFVIATGVAAAAALGISLFEPWLERYEILPLYLACATLPFYALSNMLDGIARSYNWINVALLPPYFLRPLLLLAAMAAAYFAGYSLDATTAMLAAIAATWAAAILQLIWLNVRLERTVEPGARAHHVKVWFATSLPILMVWGFYTLLTYTDILVLRQFRPPEEVAIYYAASKTLALVAFVYFSVAAAVAHKFAEYHVTGDAKAFAELVRKATQWTFWPSLAAAIVIIALGRPILGLFGPNFVEGYPLMFVLAIGLLARASVGPAERLLNMVGEQRRCSLVFLTAFAVNLVLCFMLIPYFGLLGAAISLATALAVESVLLFIVIKRRLGLHIWIWNHAGN
ncbi:MAG TPA: lipopolysaccharide biosynthesis protein [Rhizobiales bacterium]|nr:lipopolysaccharide biosynthesis protein [Hyphomicrobiales bacterium]